jgi:hypothetical protein
MKTQQTRSTEDCKHCPKNPSATKPLLKMHRLSIREDVQRDIEETAKRENKNPDCFVCETVQEVINALSQQSKD